MPGGKIGRITTTGIISEIAVPSAPLTEIATGPDNALWFIDNGNDSIGRIGLPTYTLSVSAAPSTGGTVTGVARLWPSLRAR